MPTGNPRKVRLQRKAQEFADRYLDEENNPIVVERLTQAFIDIEIATTRHVLRKERKYGRQHRNLPRNQAERSPRSHRPRTFGIVKQQTDVICRIEEVAPWMRILLHQLVRGVAQLCFVLERTSKEALRPVA